MSAVPVEGDRERLAALLRHTEDRSLAPHNDRYYERWADRLLRAGVSLTGSGLREAAQNIVDILDNAQIAWSKYPELDGAQEVLRAALSGESGEPNLVLVRRYSGGVLPDGTTNHEPIQFGESGEPKSPHATWCALFQPRECNCGVQDA